MTSADAARVAFQRALLADDPESLYERAPCAYLSTAPDGTIVKANGTFLGWTGHSREQLVGRRRFADLLAVGSRIYHESHYSPLLHMQGEAREIAFDLTRADGSRFPVLVNAVMDREPDGTPRIIRIAMFDATERRSYERELLAAKRRAEDSESRAVELARTLQETFIPPRSPVISGLDLAAEYRPAGIGDEVGGDFYDIFELGDGDWTVVLGDVSGKGVGAAVVTALMRHTVRALSVREQTPSRILHQLNEILLRDGTERFCTVVLLRLRELEAGWRVTASSGGHPLPLLLSPDQPPRQIGLPGSLVGALDDVEYDDTVVTLRPGDRLFLYTDGVTEGRRDREFFGDQRLLDLLGEEAGPPRDLVAKVLEAVLGFQLDRPRDDIAVLALGVPQDMPEDTVRPE